MLAARRLASIAAAYILKPWKTLAQEPPRADRAFLCSPLPLGPDLPHNLAISGLDAVEAKRLQRWPGGPPQALGPKQTGQQHEQCPAGQVIQ